MACLRFLEGACDIAPFEARIPMEVYVAGSGENQIGEDGRETVAAARWKPEPEAEVFLEPTLAIVAKEMVLG